MKDCFFPSLAAPEWVGQPRDGLDEAKRYIQQVTKLDDLKEMNVQILKLRLLTMTMAALCCLSSARAEVRYNISPVGPYNDPKLG